MLDWPGFSSDDVLLAVTTIAFDIAGLELFLPLIAGATMVLANAESTKDGAALLRLIEDKGVTVMQATPSTWKMMIAAGWKKKLDIKVLCCGEPMSKDLANKLNLVCTSLWNMYGPTETQFIQQANKFMKRMKLLPLASQSIIHRFTLLMIRITKFLMAPLGKFVSVEMVSPVDI
jgi:non-ribosomal peptide synthetase component F